MTNLTHTDLQELKSKIEDALEDWSIQKYPTEHRNHLGISEIGEDCKRKLFYKFRWMGWEEHSGRMRRLFARGHREEEKYINYLEGIGFKIYRFSNPILNYHPESDNLFLSSKFEIGDGLVEDVTGFKEFEERAKAEGLVRKQFRVSGVMGHYGGSCDGVGISPWYPDPLILEFKTHNTKSFTHYVEKGLQLSKPKHFDQMSGYGEKMKIEYGLYFPENKNDDDIQLAPVKLDWNRAKELEKKAESIILTNQLPTRISDNPAFFKCKYCFANGLCHQGAIPQKNCRSCKNSMPTNNATWTCAKYGLIPNEVIAKGCEQWMPI